MKLKDLEKIKLLETTLLIGATSLALFTTKNANDSLSLMEISNQKDFQMFLNLISIPRLVDTYITPKTEIKTEDYKEMKNMYNKIISNLAEFLKKQNLTEPIEVFTIYQFMLRNGFLSQNKHFEYNFDMKDLSKLLGADVIRGTGVCRTIASFLTDVYKELGYNSSNLIVSVNYDALNNIERLGNYPRKVSNPTTKKLLKTGMNTLTNLSIPDHLITLLEKDNKIYILDPTNDGIFKKGKDNKNLILPNNEKGTIKINYFISSIQKILGQMGNIKSNKELKEELNLPSIEYEEYKKTYIDTLNFCKENIHIFEEFYTNNKELYLELLENLEKQSSIFKRYIPEIYLMKDIISKTQEQLSKKNR